MSTKTQEWKHCLTIKYSQDISVFLTHTLLDYVSNHLSCSGSTEANHLHNKVLKRFP